MNPIFGILLFIGLAVGVISGSTNKSSSSESVADGGVERSVVVQADEADFNNKDVNAVEPEEKEIVSFL